MEDTPRLSDVATLRGVCSAPTARLRIADTAANETTLHCDTATQADARLSSRLAHWLAKVPFSQIGQIRLILWSTS